MSAKKTDFIFYDLISKIYQQQFTDGKLPTQRDLAASYGVSRFTIQAVLNRLIRMGKIYTVQGNGIFVEKSALRNPLILNSVTENSYENISSKILYLREVQATPEQATIFSIKSGNLLWEFMRIRIINYQITQMEISLMPKALFPDLTSNNIEESVQDYVLKCGYDIAHHITKYTAVTVDKSQAEILQCKRKAPAMNIVSRGLLQNGTVFEYSNIISLDYSATYIVPFNKKVHKLRHK